MPELVPFRLTADIVDGMGIAGTEGVFRRCAEETLRVLRSSADVIKTVLEVFNHDPLHSWYANTARPVLYPYSRHCRTATVGKLRRAQDPHGTEGPDDMFRGEESVVEGAERALTSVSRKLDASLSVEYTVNELINEATDIANLSRIFPGKDLDFIAIDGLLITGCRMESTLLNCASHCCHPPLAGCGWTDAVTK